MTTQSQRTTKSPQKADRLDRENLRVNLELTIEKPLLLVLSRNPDEVAKWQADYDSMPVDQGWGMPALRERGQTVYSRGILKLRPDALMERFDEFGEEIFSDLKSQLNRLGNATRAIYMAIPSPNPEWWVINTDQDCEYSSDRISIPATATGFSLEDYR
jgi:hypothetical protein